MKKLRRPIALLLTVLLLLSYTVEAFAATEAPVPPAPPAQEEGPTPPALPANEVPAEPAAPEAPVVKDPPAPPAPPALLAPPAQEGASDVNLIEETIVVKNFITDHGVVTGKDYYDAGKEPTAKIKNNSVVVYDGFEDGAKCMDLANVSSTKITLDQKIVYSDTTVLYRFSCDTTNTALHDAYSDGYFFILEKDVAVTTGGGSSTTPDTESTIPEKPTLTEGAAVSIVDGTGAPVTNAGLKVREGTKVSLSAWTGLTDIGDETYQWQISSEETAGVWVNINGQKSKGLLMSLAMVNSMTLPSIRCKIVTGGATKYSMAIPVTALKEDTFTDNSSNVSVAGVLPIDAKLTISKTSAAATGLNNGIYPVGGASLFNDVTLTRGSSTYQPEDGETVTVTFPESAVKSTGFAAGDAYHVYHIHDGVVDLSEIKHYNGGNVKMEFSNLSVVGISEATEAARNLVQQHGAITSEENLPGNPVMYINTDDSVDIYDTFYNSTTYVTTIAGCAGAEVEVSQKFTYADGFVAYFVSSTINTPEALTSTLSAYHVISSEFLSESAGEEQVVIKTCVICGKEMGTGCVTPHVYCSECKTFDCGKTHEQPAPEKPVTAPVIPFNPTLTSGADVTIVDEEGNPVTDTFILYEGTRASLSAWDDLDGTDGATYQWQIRYDAENDLWTNIQGQTGMGIVISPAMFAGINDSAAIRCVMNGTLISDAISVNITEQPEAVSLKLRSNARKGIATVADGGAGAQTTYNVVINYVLENNEVVGQPYTATLGQGSNFSATVTFPTIMGYLPYFGNNTESTKSYELNITNIQADVTYTVTYKPTNVKYTVIHYLQNVNDDNFTLFETEEKMDLTNNQVPEVAKAYDGFYALLYERPKIAADGSTVVEIYYDREYYLMMFNLGDGGYGVDPIYDRFEATIPDVGEPKRPGYTFHGWDPALPATMPVNGGRYTALWQLNDTAKVSFVIWGENPDDEEYSYMQTVEFNVKPGETISWDTLQYDCGNVAHTHSASCGYQCGYEAHVHDSGCYSCGNAEHTHSRSCYTVDGGSLSSNAETDSTWVGRLNSADPYRNLIYRVRQNNYSSYRYYLKIGTSYYRITFGYNQNINNFDYSVNCGETEHTHGSGCSVSCGKVEHTHSVNCYACGMTEHVHTSRCEAKIDDVMDEELWYCVRSESKEVNADGSTVINVYYDRTTFKIDFFDGNSKVYTIEDKWGADISEHWPIPGYTDGERWDPSGSETYKEVLVYIDIMPTESFNLRVDDSTYSPYYMHYMVEVLPDESETSYSYNSETKYFKEAFEISAKYNYVTEAEDFFDLDGFTQWTSNPKFSSNGRIDINGNNKNVYFYYSRHHYAIEFYSPTDRLKRTENVPYEFPLDSYEWVPDASMAPDVYEPGSVEFEGWYLNPECTGDKFDFTTKTMPVGINDGDTTLTLYAKWVPVTRTVRFYLDRETMESGGDYLGKRMTPHGSLIERVDEPNNGGYTFNGWYYLDDGVEKRFLFETMVITKDMDVYAKWSSNVLKEYVVYFKIQGTDTQIADPITGSTRAGETKTFDAKGGTELYADYQEGYFPVVKSHSMNLDINTPETPGTDPTGREWVEITNADGTTKIVQSFTFWYVQKQAVPYKVYYVAETLKGGENAADYDFITRDGKTYYIIAVTSTNSENRKAVVTEQFKTVSGYIPDAYQKRLVVDGSENAVNEIIFYYSVDSAHAYYKITHYTQNTDGENWTEYISSQAIGDIGTIYDAESITIAGFTFDPKVDGTVKEGILTADGLELKLYYTRNRYPYEVRYLEKDTGNELAPRTIGEDIYGKVISESAIDIRNYTAVYPVSQTMPIRIEEGVEAKLNIITFYYTEKEATIEYVVVGPDGSGTVSKESETLKVLSAEKASGSTASANTNYRFVGWFENPDCTGDALSPEATYVPSKPENGWKDKTYYAKFELAVADLTIKKTGCSDADENQSFIFDITGPDGFALTVTINGNGSVTIKDLLIGKYTVTERSAWSWRYEPVDADKSITLGASGNELAFENNRENGKWLSGDSLKENQFNINTNVAN